LESSRARGLAGDRWNDAEALEAALTQGHSRHPEPGRGQGLKGIKGYVHRHDGKLSIRSGTARISLLPSWDNAPAREEDLSPFIGSQLQMIIPERVGEA
jgi:hypothetical protein